MFKHFDLGDIWPWHWKHCLYQLLDCINCRVFKNGHSNSLPHKVMQHATFKHPFTYTQKDVTLTVKRLFEPVLNFFKANIWKMDIVTHYHIRLSNVQSRHPWPLTLEMRPWQLKHYPYQFSACINASLLNIDIFRGIIDIH